VDRRLPAHTEGIETQAEASTLDRLGVEFGQGYLFGRAEPMEA
jgi:EAL domain-containing protein (putative c-di-GMP-specific phosphodiesterase class I)